ncbi:MAG TPA: Fe-S cluster assembly protein SufD [Ktedonobacterales bacterium]|nr:Fe-S cluster assembly protein SufD [Ktedonobacterales bacterium]
MTAPAAPRGFTAQTVNELIERRNEPEWVRQRRLDAWKIYESIPMPTRQDEEWRRTDLRGLRLNEVAPYSEAPVTARSLLPGAEAGENYAGALTFWNGERIEYRLSEDLQRQGVIFTDMRTAVREHAELLQQYFMTYVVPPSDSKFAALHAAFWDNGTLLYVPAGAVITEPFRAIVSGDLREKASLSHTLIVLESDSQAVFAEDFVSETTGEQGFTSRVAEIILKRNAVLHYVGSQRWGRSVWDFHTERIWLGRDASATVQTVELGSELSKGRVEAILAEDGVNVKLLGLYFEDGDQHLDRYTLQDHRAANGTSDLLFKGVLTDKARSVFSGLIRVAPEGKKTAAYQQNRNILLSRHARADSIPNLEIGANDIIGCSHGATVGKVDEDQLFYLMTRGLNRLEATQLIVEGFVDPLVAEVPIPSVREELRREIQRRVTSAQTAFVE